MKTLIIPVQETREIKVPYITNGNPDDWACLKTNVQNNFDADCQGLRCDDCILNSDNLVAYLNQ